MKIIKSGKYLDGGTYSYFTEDGTEYCIDNRWHRDPNRPNKTIRVSTAGKWFHGYPNKGNCNIITDENLISALNVAKDEFEKSIR